MKGNIFKFFDECLLHWGPLSLSRQHPFRILEKKNKKSFWGIITQTLEENAPADVGGQSEGPVERCFSRGTELHCPGACHLQYPRGFHPQTHPACSLCIFYVSRGGKPRFVSKSFSAARSLAPGASFPTGHDESVKIKHVALWQIHWHIVVTVWIRSREKRARNNAVME